MTLASDVISWIRFFMGTWRKNPGDGKFFVEFISSMYALNKDGYWNAVEQKNPWVSYAMRDFFQRYLRSDMKVFEYGSGGSTIFFSDRVYSIVSVEHDKAWYQMLEKNLESLPNENYKLLFSPPVIDENSKKTWTTKEEYVGMSFESYVHTIEGEKKESLDIVFIDGRARSECMGVAKDKVKKGGIIVLDNAGRKEYRESQKKLIRDGWIEESFTGLTPGILAWDTTAIYYKPV